ncbi:MAG: hypothetical protein H6835_20675, partial [Planctomycetes bacterium]|nr:hypothetical protein [Planctomycetota bacterium]
MSDGLPRFRIPTTVCAMLVSCWTGQARAQALPLAPTADTIVPVSTSSLHYSSIDVPAGVTVWFVAAGPDLPAVVVCDGDVSVRGTLSLSLTSFPSGPGLPAGWVATGAGTAGSSCGASSYTPAGGGRHDYGAFLPFCLEGGSPGGALTGY